MVLMDGHGRRLRDIRRGIDDYVDAVMMILILWLRSIRFEDYAAGKVIHGSQPMLLPHGIHSTGSRDSKPAKAPLFR